MKLIPYVCNSALAGVFVLGAAGVASAADLSGLQVWVGKYPSDRIGGRRLFDHPGLTAEMRKTMGAQTYRRLQQIRGPEGLVVRVGNYIAAWHCQQHDCGDKNTTTIARLDKGDVVVCWQHAPERPALVYRGPRAGQRARRRLPVRCRRDRGRGAATRLLGRKEVGRRHSRATSRPHTGVVGRGDALVVESPDGAASSRNIAARRRSRIEVREQGRLCVG